MDDEAVFIHLIEVLEKLSIKVVQKDLYDDEFQITSGMCRVAGNLILILDINISIKSKISMLINELSKHNIDNFFLPPVIRNMIQKT